jgi:protein-disulfide isomerase
VDSTPSFLINGRLVKGALGFSDFQVLIDRELNRKISATN